MSREDFLFWSILVFLIFIFSLVAYEIGGNRAETKSNKLCITYLNQIDDALSWVDNNEFDEVYDTPI